MSDRVAPRTETVELPSGVSTYTREAAYNAGKRLRIGDIYYDIKYCGDYCLYYLNAYGGWDAFLIEGKVTEVDNNKFHDYDSLPTNTSIKPETNRYLVERETTWKMTTGWLTDDEAARLAKHLLSSPNVIMHDLVEDKLIPVVIKTNSAEYKTYLNNNRKLVSYSFEVTRAKTQLRRR